MKKLIYLFLMAVIIASCGENKTEEKDEPKADTQVKNDDTLVETTDTLTTDTLYIIPDYRNPYPAEVSRADKKVFREFLSDSLVAESFALYNAYDSIKTQKQMLIYYNKLIALKTKLSYSLSDLMASDAFAKKVAAKMQKEKTEGEYYDEYSMRLDYILKELEKEGKYFKGIKLTCVAECTEPYYDLILGDLIKKAETTTGEDDEKFMALIMEYYSGDSEPDAMNAKWFYATWDYGGSSKLGDGIHLAFLKATDQLAADKNIFEQYINSYREDCFSDMTRWKSYQYGREKLLKEIEKVFREVNLNESQRDELKVRKKELQEFKENDRTGHGLQLNCERGDCIYG